jgi:hypothetical protein
MAVFQARFFHDWSAGWLWSASEETRNAFGYDIDHHVIGLSPELAVELDRLAAWHESSLNRSDPGHPSPWRQAECGAFNADVHPAFSQLVTELWGAWQLVDEFRESVEDPDLDRYLRNPWVFAVEHWPGVTRRCADPVRPESHNERVQSSTDRGNLGPRNLGRRELTRFETPS